MRRANQVEAALLVMAAMAATAAMAGCERTDQKANEAGRSARAGAAKACASVAPEESESCLREQCAAPCAPFKETPTFERECIAACVARGECATDADCAEGARCVAVAPRVRRCEGPARGDAGP